MEKPKRPLSSFNLFYRYKRAVILEMTSGITTTKEDVLKILSATVGLEGDDDAVLQQSSQQQPPPAGPTNEINIRRRNKVRDALNGKILPQNNGRRRHRKSANSLGISFSELGKLMTTCWKDVDPYGKDIFEELSEEGRQIYRDQMEEYNKVKPQKDIMPTAKPKPTKPKAPPSGVSQNDKKLISANMVSMQKGMTAHGKNIINESAAAAGFPSAFLQRHGGVGATSFPPTLNDGSNWEGVGNPKLAKLMPLHRGIPPTLHRGIPPSYPPPVAVAPQQFGGHHQIPPSAAYAMAAQNAVKDTAAFRTAFPRITPSLLPTTHHHHHQIPPQYMSHYHNIATTHHPQIHHNAITSNIISYHQLVASKNVPPRMMHPFDDNNKRMHESIISRNEEHGMLEARAVPRTTSVAAAPPPPSAKINNMDVLAAAAGLAGAEEPTSSKTTEEEEDDEERELMEKLERLREKKRRGGGVVQGGGGGGGNHLPIKKRFKM